MLDKLPLLYIIDPMPFTMKLTYVVLFLVPLAVLLFYILGLPFLTLWRDEQEQIELNAEEVDEVEDDPLGGVRIRQAGAE